MLDIHTSNFKIYNVAAEDVQQSHSPEPSLQCPSTLVMNKVVPIYVLR